MKPAIGHLKPSYLPLTQTFIYTYLKHARRFCPFVLTDIALNLSAYPVACSYLLKQSDIDHYRKMLGKSCGYFLKEFFRQMDYPNCFERLIRERKIPLLHAHFGTAGCGALDLKRRLGIPLITSFYGIDASCQLRDNRMRKAFGELFETGDLFLVLGNNMAQRLSHAGCPREKIVVQRLAIDPNRIPFQPRRPPGANDPIVLLYCGRLVEKKGILHAIEAFARLADGCPNLEFRIVGEGPLERAAHRMVCEKNLQHRVKFLGRKPHASALAEMQNAHLLILPSRVAQNGDMEGTPTVLLEAQASGLPVVSTFHADIPEVVRNGETGILAPENNVEALVEALVCLLERPERWAEMGLSGRRHVEAHYNIEIEMPGMEALYAKWIAS